MGDGDGSGEACDHGVKISDCQFSIADLQKGYLAGGGFMSVVESTPPKVSEPAWGIARLFPAQGNWSEGDYLSLTDNTRHLVELVDGRVEVLSMPTQLHQNFGS